MLFVLIATIGLLASIGSNAGLIASLAIPALIFLQPTRLRATCGAVTYYACALWAIVPVARTAVTPAISSAMILWIFAALLLSLPWAVCWSQQSIRLRVVIAITLGAVPPLGVIGMASPLVSAGLLFPGTSWIGLACALLLAGELASSPRRAMITGTLVALLGNVVLSIDIVSPADWKGLNTNLPTGAERSPILAYMQERKLQRLVLSKPAKVLILPESVVRDWTAATDELWADLTNRLKRSNRLLVLGGTIPAKTGYRNTLIVRGAETGLFEQRIPVPLGMWRPFSRDGVPMNLFGPSTLNIAGERAAVLICYEQLLIWPILLSSVERPTVLIAVSNLASVPADSVGAYQRSAIRSWGRLFRLPVVLATNQLP